MEEEELGSEVEVEGRVGSSKGRGWDRGSSGLERKLGGPCRWQLKTSGKGWSKLSLWWFEEGSASSRVPRF